MAASPALWQLPPETASRVLALGATRVLSRRNQRRSAQDLHLSDPLGWLTAYIRWPPGIGLTDYQTEVIEAVPTRRRVAVRGPHGLGKTTTAALVVIWFALTREAAGLDWKCITTASAWRQLVMYLWPEIRKWLRLVDWAALRMAPWRLGVEVLQIELKGAVGAASAVASDNPALIEGTHAEEILYVFDEAKAIPPEVWDAAEGAFSGAGRGTTANAYALAISTPGEAIGRFWQIQTRKPGTEDWWVRHVTLAEAIAAGRISADWSDQRRAQWGVGSAVWGDSVIRSWESPVIVNNLDDRLRGTPRPIEDAEQREALRRRVRLAFYGGAEERSRQDTGRPLTGDEAQRVVGRFPGR